ncbi:hypothetical protein [Pantoea sp. B65]|uniref:hypothetical protein n=1 Tax=Pantoea sp. B65 TaxID=2813359 RepID=UPI0039B408B6
MSKRRSKKKLKESSENMTVSVMNVPPIVEKTATRLAYITHKDEDEMMELLALPYRYDSESLTVDHYELLTALSPFLPELRPGIRVEEFTVMLASVYFKISMLYGKGYLSPHEIRAQF